MRNGFETRIVVEGLAYNDSVVVEAVGGVSNGAKSASVTVEQGC